MKIFVVNLERDTEKKAAIQKLCESYHLDYKIITAVSGKDLSSADLDKYYDEDQALVKHGRKLSLGEVGCALSHLNIYKEMLESGLDEAFILEDDVNFDQTLVGFLKSLDLLPNTVDLVLAGHNNAAGGAANLSHWGKQSLAEGKILCRPASIAFGTYAYYITRRGATKILDQCESGVYLPIDHFTGNSQFVNVTACEVPIVFPSEYGDESNIAVEREGLQEEMESHKCSIKDKIKSLRLFKMYKFSSRQIRLCWYRWRPLEKYH